MTTERQRLSNQRNGRLSRGPKTAAGKARSRRNAFRHGLSANVFVDAEKSQQIANFARLVAHDTSPENARELATGDYELRQVRLYQARLMSILHKNAAGSLVGAVTSISTDIGELGSAPPTAAAMVSRPVGTAPEAANPASPEDSVSKALHDLLNTQRYERQAQAKLRRAMRRK